ncbi:formate/nitrite transporter family protein [Streptobacillus felis]|uniref:Formate/nitrite transporter family protein n=1 Tax=Streptobacillus felis TaxID=1384509 RepID=A0A7Z0PER8_9FUSO|nr:formate/nitrite transporter family protein [Streptobacillus felis]NYV27393.1 formate/nitrite transporter family protein [Streptobacillus felis]
MLKTQKELMEYVIHATEKRMKRPFSKLALLSILGGMFIAFGSVGNIITAANLIETNAGIAKFFGAAVFPVGLIAIVVLGLELFTSNCMMTIAHVEKKINILKMLKILVIVWIFNLVGSIFVAYITYQTHTLSDAGITFLSHLAEHKTHTSAYDLILKGILCNVLVCGASLLGYIAKDGISKIFGIWFPIMLFIILGYDHVVANMLYLPLSLMHGVEGVTFLNVSYNFIFVTIGNFIGGGLVIGLTLWYCNKD